MEPHIIALLVIFAIALSLIVSICMIRKHKKEELLRIERQRQWEAGREERERRAKEEAERKALEQRLAKERYDALVQRYLNHKYVDDVADKIAMGYGGGWKYHSNPGEYGYRQVGKQVILAHMKGNGECTAIGASRGEVEKNGEVIEICEMSLIAWFGFSDYVLPPITDFEQVCALVKAIEIKYRQELFKYQTDVKWNGNGYTWVANETVFTYRAREIRGVGLEKMGRRWSNGKVIAIQLELEKKKILNKW